MSQILFPLTFTGQGSLFQKIVNNTSTENADFGDTFINQYTLELVHKFPALFSERTFSLQTFPSTRYYNLPVQLRKVNTVVINVGNTGAGTNTGAGFNWPVKEAPSQEFWNQINMVNTITSDIPLWYWVQEVNNVLQLGIYPMPAAGYNPITIRGQAEITSVSQPDYTTGTIVSVPYALTLTGAPAAAAISATLTGAFTLPTGTYQMIFNDASPLTTTENILVTLTNGSTAITWTQPLTNACTTAVTLRTLQGGDIVTGSGTSWNDSMVGYMFRVPYSSSTNGGDNFPYTINQVYSTTALALNTSYGGTAISAGSSTYTIGQISIIPTAYQMIPVHKTTEMYYSSVKKDEELKKDFKGKADELFAQMMIDFGNRDTNPTVQDDFGTPMINPNLTVNITGSSTNQ